jgi:ATP-dependent helicase/DNAse subunit B
MKIEHISVSRTTTWQTCPQQYKYKYHLKVPTPEEPIYFLFGKIVHKIIEHFTINKGKIPITQVMNDVLSGNIELEKGKKATALPADYRRRLPQNLKNFLKLNEHISFEGDVEWKFDLDLDPPNHKLLTGLIDRLIYKNNKIFIIDYKTTRKGKFRKNKETIKSDLQMQVYCRIAQLQYELPADRIQTALYFLEDGELVSTSFPQSALDSVEKSLLEIYNTISEKDADHVIGRVGPHCDNCDYKHMCPFFRLKHSYYDLENLLS